MKKQEKKRKILKELITGSLVKNEISVKQFIFFVFLAVLSIIYISNRYAVEKLIIQSHNLRKEIKELKSEYVIVTKKLMYMSKESEVQKLVNENNLKLNIPQKPPYRLEIDN